MTDNAAQMIAQAVEAALISPNVSDSNLEPANIVDAIDRLATSIFALADAVRKLPHNTTEREAWLTVFDTTPIPYAATKEQP